MDVLNLKGSSYVDISVVLSVEICRICTMFSSSVTQLSQCIMDNCLAIDCCLRRVRAGAVMRYSTRAWCPSLITSSSSQTLLPAVVRTSGWWLWTGRACFSFRLWRDCTRSRSRAGGCWSSTASKSCLLASSGCRCKRCDHKSLILHVSHCPLCAGVVFLLDSLPLALLLLHSCPVPSIPHFFLLFLHVILLLTWVSPSPPPSLHTNIIP